jgi:CheY-like chemotaxis protein
MGMSKHDIENIFEPFYTKKKMGRSGTGLGMSVVWGTVKDHRGYIDINSEKGKGSRFTLFLPATREALKVDSTGVSIDEYQGDGESILVIDDVEEQREIASTILKKLKYAVVSVSSGEEAIEYMQSNSADLLVIDMIMDPGMDGLDTYKKIIELHPHQKAIVASGFSRTDRIRQLQKMGAGQYIKKPYTLAKIGSAVKEALGRNRQTPTSSIY